MLSEAFAYPRHGDDWLKRIGIGGLLFIFSFLIVPGILLFGYFARVLRSAAMDEEMPPTFDDYGDMLVDGLKMYVISIAYTILPLIVIAVLSLAGSLVGGGSIIGLVVALVAFAVLFVASYSIPAAMTNFALHDSLGAAFDFRTVFGAAFTGRYLIALVLAVVVGTILLMVASLLSIIIVGLFLLFYVTVFIFYLYGTGCGPQLREGRASEAMAD